MSSNSDAVRIGHNSTFLITSQVLSKLAGFTGVVLLARILEVSDFGVFSLALAVTGIVSILVELGLDQLMIREIARDHSRISEDFMNAAVIKLFLTALALASTFLVLNLTGLASASSRVIIILTIALLPAGFYHLIVSMFMGLERMAYVAAGNLLAELLRLVLMALVLLTGYGLEAIAWMYVISIMFVAITSFAVMRLKVNSELLWPSLSAMLSMARQSLPFMVVGLFFIIYFKIDFIMLAWMKDETMVGSYAAAYRLMESLLFIPAAFMGAVYPTLSRLSSARRASLLDASSKTMRYMAMIGIPIGFGTTVLAEQIILFLFGEAYAESVLPLQIIIWALVLIFLNCICLVGLNSINLQKLGVLVTGAGIICNVTLNLILIPPYGAVGASSSTVATEVFTTILFLWLFKTKIGSIKLASVVYRPLLAALIMSAALLALPSPPLAVLILVGVIVYLACLVLLGGLKRTDLDLAISTIRPLLGNRSSDYGG